MTAETTAVLGREEATDRPALSDAVVAVATVGGSIACWLFAVRNADLSQLTGFGLITGLPRVYFVGLALLVLGFAYQASRAPARRGLLAAHVLALVVEIHATTAVLYDEPRYSWTYKHLGVIDYIQANGEVHRSIDIYNNWPGFFAVTAWFAKAAGVRPIAIAPWAQLFFELASVAAIVFAVRGLTRDPRRVWTAAFLFVIANWVGQDYLSPQATAFVLCTVVLGLVLRLPGRTGTDAPGLRPGALAAAAIVCSLAVIVTHQLSPGFLILDLCALWVLTRRPRLWLIGVIVAAEVVWVGLGWSFISTHFSLFDTSSSLNNKGSLYAHPLPGVILGQQAAQLSMTAMSLLGLVGFLVAWRRGKLMLVPGVLAAMPFPLVVVQRYGGEGPLRAYLFALPWLALIACELFFPEEGRPSVGRSRPLLLVAAAVTVAFGSLFGYFGQETLNKISPDDVAASRWYLDNAPAGALSVLYASNFPEKIDRNYVDHLDASEILVRKPGVAGPQFATRGMAALEKLVHGTDKETYVIVTPSQIEYLRYQGMAPPGAADQLTRAIERSKDFRLVFRSGFSEIFRYQGAA